MEMDIDGEAAEPAAVPLRLRSYQQEMFDASMKKNVIVAMDTGSGKTHIATARILAELEGSSPDKLVWFLCPSVALTDQQYNALKPYLTAYGLITLKGADGVDKWTEQRLWDAMLTNIRVVFATPKVLEEALSHGFVKMSRLALLVFDEAHRCTKNSPMNVIMRDHYHHSKAKGDDVPHILGLSASPVMSTKQGSLAEIEANLDAIAVTPKKQRETLEQFVHPPVIKTATYAAAQPFNLPSLSEMCNILNQLATNYSFDEDPYVIDLQRQDNAYAHKQLAKLAEKPKTDCSEELSVLDRRAHTLYEQLGPTAAEWYITSYTERFAASADAAPAPSEIKSQEQQHLLGYFGSVRAAPALSSSLADPLLSDKVQHLISMLVEEASPSVRGIIFVEQRATVSALVQLLRSTAAIATSYNVGGFVGMSTFASRRSSIADLAESKQQQKDLEDFRTGAKNLMIATSVLEEGIDVSACNLVVCFDLPKTLVAFVQRRGRARQRRSKYFLFVAETDLQSDPAKWQRLEAEMKQSYMSEERRPTDVASVVGEDDQGALVCRVASTSALLTAENAKAHLYHFCAISTLHSNYIDVRPEFETMPDADEKTWTASVTLPAFVHQKLRFTKGSKTWSSEAAAIRDVAFQAYIALHKAGLVNDNLLPLVKDNGPEAGQQHVDQPSLVTVAERRRPFAVSVQQSNPDAPVFGGSAISAPDSSRRLLYPATVTTHDIKQPPRKRDVWLPSPLACSINLSLYWNETTTVRVAISEREPAEKVLVANSLDSLREYSHGVLRSVHGTRMSDQNDFVMLFSPADSCAQLPELFDTVPAVEWDWTMDPGLVRVENEPGRAYIYQRIQPANPTASGDMDKLVVTRFPKRTDFLHRIPERQEVSAVYTAEHIFSIADCTIDKLDAREARFAAFMPSIMHRIEIHFHAKELQETILKPIGITNLSLILEAISAPSAGEDVDYNRLEYLGDAILKFCAHLQVTAQHPTWPESYLSLEKQRLVRNSTLTKAAVEAGLDQYILTKPFTGSKWRPVYISDLLSPHNDSEDKRQISSKVLADVVEALFGAAYVDGGLEKAYLCIQTLLPHETWYPQAEIFTRLTEELAPCTYTNLALLEQLVGHHFTHPTLLVEAITHASLPFQRTGLSYERLEFLGDAVLDLLLVPKLFNDKAKLKHWQMHSLHSAVVNGDFLGFCCLAYGAVSEQRFTVSKEDTDVKDAEARQVYLHDFIRAGGEVRKARVSALERLARLAVPAIPVAMNEAEPPPFNTPAHPIFDATEIRNPTEEALQRGKEYPWAELLGLNLPKFLSDLIESVLGALYIDTSGDLCVCEAFIRRMGVLDYLARFLRDKVEMMNPKERIGILAGDKKVEYAATSAKIDSGMVVWSCAVSIGGIEAAAVSECGSRAEAEARAACAAIKMRAEETSPSMTECKKRKWEGQEDGVLSESGDEVAAQGGAEL